MKQKSRESGMSISEIDIDIIGEIERVQAAYMGRRYTEKKRKNKQDQSDPKSPFISHDQYKGYHEQIGHRFGIKGCIGHDPYNCFR